MCRPSGAVKQMPFRPKGRSTFSAKIKLPSGAWASFALGTKCNHEAKILTETLQEISNDILNMKSLTENPEYILAKINSFLVKCGTQPVKATFHTHEQASNSISLRELSDKFVSQTAVKAKSTDSKYKTFHYTFLDILGDDADRPATDFTEDDAQAYLSKYASGDGGGRDVNGRKSSTIDAHAKRAKSMFDYCNNNHHHINRNPFLKHKDWIKQEKPLEKLPFTDAEIKRLQSVQHPEWRLLSILMSCTAMRLGDALACGSEYFTKVDGKLCLSWTPKKVKRKMRDVYKPLTIPVIEPLLSAVSDKVDQDSLFPTLSLMGASKVSQKFHDIMREADVDYDTQESNAGHMVATKGTHSFRHYVNTKMRESGVSKEVRMAVSGHHDSTVSDGYSMHNLGEELNKLNK